MSDPQGASGPRDEVETVTTDSYIQREVLAGVSSSGHPATNPRGIHRKRGILFR